MTRPSVHPDPIVCYEIDPAAEPVDQGELVAALAALLVEVCDAEDAAGRENFQKPNP